MEVAGHIHATAPLIPVICPPLPIEYVDGMGPRGGLEVPQKRHRLPRPDIGLCLSGCRGYSLDQACETVTSGKFFLARGIHGFPNNLFIFPEQRLYVLKNVCIYKHI